MEKKALIIATVVKKHIMQFHIPTMKMLSDEGWTVDVAAKNDYEDPDDCNIPYCNHYYDIQFERNPFKPKNICAYRELKKIIKEGKYDVIHCHTPVGGVLGRLAARGARKKGTKVFYTAHGFHFYKGAPIMNWLLWYPVEKFCAHFTDTLITINEEDYNIAQKSMRAEKIEFVNGVGIDLHKFSSNLSEEEISAKRKELGLNENDKMLISVGEFRKAKNHEFAVNVLSKLKKYDWKYYICGGGEAEDDLLNLIEKLDLKDRVFLLGYRRDISYLLNCADLFIFPSKREGLPVALMEALSCNTKCIASNIRGNRDLLNDDFLFELNEESLLSLIEKNLTDNNQSDKKMCRTDIDKLSAEAIMNDMRRIYNI